MNVNERLLDYAERLSTALQTVDPKQLAQAYCKLKSAYLSRRDVYVCGNGGSLSMSENFVVGHGKGLQYDTDLNPRIQSLTSSPLISAIANDVGYDYIFSYQIEMKGNQDDVLIAISASGNSPNIIKALATAKEKELITIAFVGFDGGKAKEIADIVIHVNENNCGIIEDAHQSVMHILAQSLREEFHSKKKALKL